MLIELLFALALSCRPAVAPPVGYEAAVSRVPACHWSLVRSAAIDRVDSDYARRRDMSIHLYPAARTSSSTGDFLHEVGHIVEYADPALERDWRAAFWPNGRPVGELSSRYARTSNREDFAESYREYVQRDGHLNDAGRERFLRERVFR